MILAHRIGDGSEDGDAQSETKLNRRIFAVAGLMGQWFMSISSLDILVSI